MKVRTKIHIKKAIVNYYVCIGEKNDYIPSNLSGPLVKGTVSKKDLKEIYGYKDEYEKSGNTWDAILILKPISGKDGEEALSEQESEHKSFVLEIDSIYTGTDGIKQGELVSTDNTSGSMEDIDVDDAGRKITNGIAKWVEEFCEHTGGKIIQTIMDPIGNVIGDGIQWIANLVQSLPDDTYRDKIVLYTYKDLATDNKDGVDNTGISGDSTSTAKNNTSSTNQIVFIGDSRTEGLRGVNTNSSNVFQCKSSMGYDWMMSTGFPAADSYAKQGTSFIILMGVNDLYNQSKYITAINSKAKEWTSKGANVFYASVGPVENDPYASNSEIESFNNALKSGLSSDVTFIDLYAELTSNGFKTVDGTHYTTDTDKRILQFLEEQVKSGRNNNSNTKFV